MNDTRLNLCEQAAQVQNGTLELSDALRGQSISVIALANNPAYARWDEIDAGPRQPGGLHPQLLTYVGISAGVDVRVEIVSPSEFLQHMRFDGFLQLATAHYDLVLGNFLMTPARAALGLRAPSEFLDLSVVATTRPEQGEGDIVERLFSFAAPFSWQVWAVFLAISVVTGLSYVALEGRSFELRLKGEESLMGNLRRAVNSGLHHRLRISDVSMARRIIGAGMLSLYDTASVLIGDNHFQPATASGKLLSLSYGFMVLIFVSSYTANREQRVPHAHGSQPVELRYIAIICAHSGTGLALSSWHIGPRVAHSPDFTRVTRSWQLPRYWFRPATLTLAAALKPAAGLARPSACLKVPR